MEKLQFVNIMLQLLQAVSKKERPGGAAIRLIAQS